jgi:hypothetical protein
MIPLLGRIQFLFGGTEPLRNASTPWQRACLGHLTMHLHTQSREAIYDMK